MCSMTKLDSLTRDDVKLSDENTVSVLHGYAKVVEHMVYQAITSGSPPRISKKTKGYYLVIRDWENRRRENIWFAKHSDLLHHFCDIYDLNLEKVRRAIIKANQ